MENSIPPYFASKMGARRDPELSLLDPKVADFRILNLDKMTQISISGMN